MGDVAGSAGTVSDRIPGARYRVTFEVECVESGGLTCYVTTADGRRAFPPSDAVFTLIGTPEPTVPGTVIRDADGRTAVHGGHGVWWVCGLSAGFRWRDFAQPVTVLYTPEVTE